MRHPHRTRTLYLLLTLLAAAGVAASFFLEDRLSGLRTFIVGTGGTLILVFGWATFYYQGQASRLSNLRAGKDLLGKWTVDPARWHAFLALNVRLNNVPGAAPYRVPVRLQQPPPAGIPITFARNAVLIGDDFHELDDAGQLADDYGPFWIEGPPACLEFQFRLPTEPQEDYRIALRIPSAAGDEATARLVCDDFRRRRTRPPA